MKNIKFNITLILNISTFILGLIFILSGIGKVVDTESFANFLSQYGSNLFGLLSPVFAVMEIFLGISLILKFETKIISVLLIFLIIFFTLIFTYGLLFLDINNCECFGRFSSYELNSPLFYYLKNIFILSLGYFIYKKNNYKKTITEKHKLLIILIVTICASFFSGYSFKYPEKFKNFNDRNKIKITDEFRCFLDKSYNYYHDSTYLVFIYSYNCPYCDNSVENVKQYKEKSIVDKIIYIGFGDKLKNKKFMLRHNISHDIIILDDNWIEDLNLRFPTVFIIQNNIPVYKQTGLVDFPYLFLKRNKNLLNLDNITNLKNFKQ